MHWIKSVRYLREHKLKLKFEDGQYKIVDLKPHLTGKVFKPLTDTGYFRRVKLNKDIDTIVWPNNADFSPDFLYKIGEK
ncbi:MAG: DUF2442 domain-containing protein [Elusimicrobia bacterium]|nr:DUF2442 domain-containing protein [Elusimicrobiota bacterium]